MLGSFQPFDSVEAGPSIESLTLLTTIVVDLRQSFEGGDTQVEGACGSRELLVERLSFVAAALLGVVTSQEELSTAGLTAGGIGADEGLEVCDRSILILLIAALEREVLQVCLLTL